MKRQKIGAFLSKITMLLILSASESFAVSQVAWDDELDAKQRFVAYPHVHAGLQAMDQSQFDTAIEEFQYALNVAPANPVIAGYLARAYASSGDFARSIETLDRQQLLTPNEKALGQMRNILATDWFNSVLREAQALSGNAVRLRQFLQQDHPKPTSAYGEHQWLGLLANASSAQTNLTAEYALVFDENAPALRRYRLARAIADRDQTGAIEIINQWPVESLVKGISLDEITYQLLEDKQPELSLRLLMRAYPFAASDSADRAVLFARMQTSASQVRDEALFSSFLSQLQSAIVTSRDERDWLTLTSDSATPKLDTMMASLAIFPENQAMYFEEIERRLRANEHLPAGVQWAVFVRQMPIGHDSLLEALSYRLLAAGDDQQAWDVLMFRYPFQTMPLALRTELIGRLALIAKADPPLVSTQAQLQLSTPLSNATLRELQASILYDLGNCNGVRSVLGDLDTDQSSRSWRMIGECYQKLQRPGLAQLAFEKAVASSPTPENQRALAYAAFGNKDLTTALTAWMSLTQSGNLSASDQLAAVVTAHAATQNALAKQWLLAYETVGGPTTARYWALKAQLISSDSLANAIEAMQYSLALDPKAGNYVLLADWQQQVDDMDGAVASLKTAITLEPNNSVALAQLGFIEYAHGNYASAQMHLTTALAGRPNDPRLTQQLAYTHQKLGENETAIQYAQTAIEQLDQFTKEEITPGQEQTLYALRRMNEDMKRRWTLSADALIGSSAAASANAPEPGQNYRNYTQIEVDYRLGNPAIDNGRTLSIYARVFGGSTGTGSPWSMSNPVLGLGLRWKPLSEQVMYLAIERQTPLDAVANQEADTLLRASASFFNDGQYSDDWHPLGAGWIAQNLYLDAAYYLNSDAYALTADYRFGYHHKLSHGQTVEPYARALANQISNESTTDLRLAAGVRWNLWANETTYSAYSRRFYVGIEIQGALQTYQSDRFAFLLNMGARW
jgi:adsorption protein A